MRLETTESAFSAASWLICHFLWVNDGASAWMVGKAVLGGLHAGFGPHFAPRSDEELIDAWIALAQLCLIDVGSATTQAIFLTVPQVREACCRSGDAIRRARVEGLVLLALGRTSEDIMGAVVAAAHDFRQAERVHDGFALGMRKLAIARWMVGPGGLALAKKSATKQTATEALSYADEAIIHFENQGMDPWILYTWLIKLKAHLDQNDFDRVDQILYATAELRRRFPIFDAHFLETQAQSLLMVSSPMSGDAMEEAVDSAKQSGLFNYASFLKIHKEDNPEHPMGY